MAARLKQRLLDEKFYVEDVGNVDVSLKPISVSAIYTNPTSSKDLSIIVKALEKELHITSAGIESAFNEAVKRAIITKNVSIHTFRHAFATHLLEDGVTLLQIKELLGHASIKSTTIYLHLANLTSDIKSPLDNLPAFCRSDGSSND